jgi:hypothetical protein
VERGGRKDFIKLLDFGIAKILEGDRFDDSEVAIDTSDGQVLGTPAYVSPEQLMGQELDFRADIYCFGLLLFQVLTGKRPFRSKSLPELVQKQLNEKPPSLSDLMDAPVAVPPRLDRLVRRCLEKARDDRPADMGEVVVELEQINEDAGFSWFNERSGAIPVAPGPDDPPRRPTPLVGGGVPAWLPVAGGAAAVVLVGALLIALFSGGDDDPSSDGDKPAEVATPPPPAEDPRLARIDGGEAEAVLAELDAIPADKLVLADRLLRGHALAALDKRDEAYAIYEEALRSDALDRRALEVTLSALQQRKAKTAIDLLSRWPKGRITEDLQRLTESKEWWPRHHALYILDTRLEGGGIDRERFAIVDLETGPECKARRYGLKKLSEHGKSEAALAALDAAAKRNDNGCLKKRLDKARAAITERVGAGGTEGAGG